MRYPFESGARQEPLGSWTSHKNKGKQLYERGSYAEALTEFQSALEPTLEAPRQEQQILLSNVVACRLKIGGQEEEAVRDAQRCVEINKSWAKGHVRLASAYIALGGHSNDACNELQTSLRIDPGNSMARQMLVRELRRSHAGPAAPAARESSNHEGFRPDSPMNPNYQHPSNNSSGSVPMDDPIDDSPSLMERLRFGIARVVTWYENQSSDTKTLLKVGLGLLVLYVSFGGRFGMEMYPTGQTYRGNYARDHSNRRDDYGQGSYNSHNSYGNSHNSYGNSHNSYGNSHSSYVNSHNSYGNSRRNFDWYHDSRHTGYSSYSSYSSNDSSFAYVALVLGVAYLCHVNGINPLHALFMMNMIGGGRRRGFGYGHYGGGYRFGGFGGRRRRW